MSTLTKEGRETYNSKKLAEIKKLKVTVNNCGRILESYPELKRSRIVFLSHYLNKVNTIKTKQNVLKFPIHLNKYYISVGANLASDVPPVVLLGMVNDMDYRVVSDVRLEPVSEDEIVEVVKD